MPLSDLQDAKEQVRQAVDIVDLIGGYMALRRQGRNFVGLCPWHDDSRPSLQVNPERQSFKCYVCDIGGDVFSFIMRTEGLEFREALEMLAERAGITLTPTKSKGQASQFDRRNLLSVMAWAEREFHHCLLKDPIAEGARQYLAERGINDESIAQFHLGYSPDEWDWLLNRAKTADFSGEVLERVGLVLRRESGGFYDRFRGRLLFSIRDALARPIAFGGRILPGTVSSNPDRTEAKYINSPETPLFSKGSQLYALDLARDAISKQQGLVVMEGYTDVIMAHQCGIQNAVAVLGTALGEKHIPLVRRFTDSITLVLDGDEAGQRRTMQILDELLALFVAHEIDLRILSLPTGADPCDVISSQGSEAFQQRLNESLDALDYKIDAVTNGLASAPGTHRSALAVEELIGTLARALPASARSTSSTLVREQQVLSRLSRQFSVGEETLRSRLAAVRREQSSRAVRRPLEQDLSTPVKTTPLRSWERELVELMIHHPTVFAQLSDHITAEDIPHELCRHVFVISLDLMHAGQIPTFDQLMLACDEAAVKNLLVDCDESGRDKSNSDLQQRVNDLLNLLANQKQSARHQVAMSELTQKRLDPGEEDLALNAIFQDLKRKDESQRRQAGSLPTDG
ncbi:DNA primase [Bythopirellula polymerisocia]|uniref:DNA primase n=1 Tax=Bythopirellula polymerisocia TaxID=2528003 RepID=A0A5C6D071_9BACT|nr:DNA primase [Bythopirellula polymerisocia]TWU28309.1 DNA primase [Bythopirellula polymerisocia]